MKETSFNMGDNIAIYITEIDSIGIVTGHFEIVPKREVDELKKSAQKLRKELELELAELKQRNMTVLTILRNGVSKHGLLARAKGNVS